MTVRGYAAAAFVMAAIPGTAHAQTGPFGGQPTLRGDVPGELIVKFRPGVDAGNRADALRHRGARLERSLAVPRAALAALPTGADPTAAATALERDPRVAYAEPNVYRRAGAVPNDPFFAEQWGLSNGGQAVEGVTGAAGADIHAAAAWDRVTGSPAVKVAVVDSGINFDQPDLAPNIWRNPGESGGGRETNGIDDDGDGFVDDWRGWDFVQQDNSPSDNNGHGTHVAGIIAARGNNGLGTTGVAWRASLIPVRVLGNANLGTCASIASGLEYAVHVGARIVNLSAGGDVPCQLERDVIDAAPNTLFVVAAMNDGMNVDANPIYPCSYPSPNIVCVAATDSRDQLADFSNYGTSNVDLAAPGASVLSTYVNWGPVQEVFSDDFETPLTGRWITGGSPDTWTRTPFAATRSGGYSLSNSLVGGYQNNTDNWAELVQGLDLSGRRDCAATIWVKKSLGPFDGTGGDVLTADPSPDGLRWGTFVSAQVGTNAGFEKWLVDLAPLEERATGRLRFGLVADGSGTFGGVALDDLRVFCVPPVTSYTGARNEFAFDFGTSMATPHVSGVAALLLSLQPEMTAAQVKQRILATVDPVPSLAGKTVSEGRLNAARAVALPTSPPPPGGGQPTPPPHGGTSGPSRAQMTAVMAAQLRLIATAVRQMSSRRILRADGFAGARLFAPGAGRLTLELKSRALVIASGSCSVRAADRCSPHARLTRRGRKLLRRARNPRLTVVLVFAPRSGAPIVQRTTATLGRSTSTSRNGGSR